MLTAQKIAAKLDTTCQPPMLKAIAKTISDSHSVEIHGLPAAVYEKKSTVGTCQWSRIHCPVWICQNVSGSESNKSLGKNDALALIIE